MGMYPSPLFGGYTSARDRFYLVSTHASVWTPNCVPKLSFGTRKMRHFPSFRHIPHGCVGRCDVGARQLGEATVCTESIKPSCLAPTPFGQPSSFHNPDLLLAQAVQLVDQRINGPVHRRAHACRSNSFLRLRPDCPLRRPFDAGPASALHSRPSGRAGPPRRGW